jgi:hypothetical protein
VWGGHSCPPLLTLDFSHPVDTGFLFVRQKQKKQPHTGTKGGIHRLNPFILRILGADG